jgi:hypothetical protein
VDYTPEIYCNHYHECPSYVCPCPPDCGCRIATCKNIPGKQYFTIDDLQDHEYPSKDKNMSGGMDYKRYDCAKCGKRLREDTDDEEKHLCIPNPETDKFDNCIRCGKYLGSMVVHTERECDLHKQARNPEVYKNPTNESIKMINEAFKKMNKSPTPSDEDLAFVFFEYARTGKIPRIPEGQYGSGETVKFDDLPLKLIREMAAFVRAMRQ